MLVDPPVPTEEGKFVGRRDGVVGGAKWGRRVQYGGGDRAGSGNGDGLVIAAVAEL